MDEINKIRNHVCNCPYCPIPIDVVGVWVPAGKPVPAWVERLPVVIGTATPVQATPTRGDK